MKTGYGCRGAVLAVCLLACGMLQAEEPVEEAAESAPQAAFFARIIAAGEVENNVFSSAWTRLGWTDRIAWEPGAQRVEVPDGVGVPIVISPYYPPHVTPTFLVSMDKEVTIGHLEYGLRKNVNFTLQGPQAIRVNAGIEPGAVVDNTHAAIVGEGRIQVVGAPEVREE